MHWAVANQHTEIIKILKERGGLEDVADEDGVTPAQINLTINSTVNKPSENGAKGMIDRLIDS